MSKSNNSLVTRVLLFNEVKHRGHHYKWVKSNSGWTLKRDGEDIYFRPLHEGILTTINKLSAIKL